MLLRLPTFLPSAFMPMSPDLQRWSEPQKYWLNRLTMKEIESGMYESTMASNGHTSDWRAEPVLVPKYGSVPWAKKRLTFNYSHVDVEIPGTQPLLRTEVRDQLSESSDSEVLQRFRPQTRLLIHSSRPRFKARLRIQRPWFQPA